MPLLCTLLIAAVAPSTFFAGPAKVGDSVTYRISTTMSAAQTAPDVSTIVLSWKAPAKFYARLAASNAAPALAVTRAADGQLAPAAPDPSDPTAATIGTLLDQLNFPGHLAATLDGSDHAQTSLNVTPPAPASSASPAPRPAAPVNVPLDVNLLGGESAVTIIAQGNSSQRGSSYGGRSGGAMGGWQSRRPARSQGQSNGKAPTVDIAMQAIFDRSGVLLHATYRETFTAQSPSGSQTVEHTITIDRTDAR
jgi:hypothetical protein